MITLISTLILICSILGMGMILFRKVPALVELPEVSGGFDIKIKFIKILTIFNKKR